MIPPLATTLLVLTVLLVLLPAETYAFGAGEIPDFAYLNNKAFRHGDIENVLAELAKNAGGVGGASILGFAQSLMSAASGGAKFSSSDVKKVYFGNWLRDYSQAMDIAGLSKLTADTLVLIVSVLGFLTFGFATEEFQVTAERLGVYLPTEHIDNPKGYAEKEGDARQFHPKLRPPVNPEELEIDPETGMKNYMASENRGWDTSTALIRRVFRACIEHGRRSGGNEGADLWEAYRLLGTGLHTMEDLLAHSNWCEIALRKMGHEQVFCHVGDEVLINTPNGEAPPLVTGTFGSADFLHSLMGEATDHLSQASVVDLTKNLENAQQNDTDSSLLRTLLKQLPIGGGGDDEEKVSQADAMKEKAQAYEFNPDDVAPPEVQQQLFQLLKWRDGIYRDVIKKIEMVPGLEELIDNLTNALNAFVYTILAPYLAPILKQVTDVLSEGSKAVIDSDDQYEVFTNPNASDPSHSLLSKDHFALILNEPAGKIAQLVVRSSVKLLVDAWFNDENPDRVIDQILEAFHHPYFNTGRSRIQQEMFEEMERWIRGLDSEESERTIQALTKESVRAGQNKRKGSDDDMSSSTQVYGQPHAQTGSAQGGYGSSQSGGRQQGYQSSGNQYGGSGGGGGYSSGRTEEPRRQQQSSYGGDDSYGSRPQQSGYGDDSSRVQSAYGSQSGGYGSGRRHGEEESSNRYGGGGDSYGAESRSDSYGRSGYGQQESQQQQSSYGQQQSSYGQQQSSYGGQERRQESGGYNPTYVPATSDSYGESRPSESHSSRRQEGYGSSGGYGSSRREEEPSGYGGRTEESRYGGRNTEESSYGESRRGGYEQPEESSYVAPSRGGYGQSEEPPYGESRRGGYGEESSGYGGRSGGDDGERRHHGGHRNDGDEYGSGGRGGYGENESRGGYGGGGGGGYGGESRGGYGGESRGGYGGESRGGYGGGEGRGGYGGGDETFGAERLNINDEEPEERPHHGRHHRRDYDE